MSPPQDIGDQALIGAAGAGESLERCYTDDGSEEGIAFNHGSIFNRFGNGQRILAGSDYIGETLTTASFYLRKGNGMTPTGTLTCRVVPDCTDSSTALSGTIIGTTDLAGLNTYASGFAKVNFTGTGTRVLAANDCIILYMPASASPTGYQVLVKNSGAGTIDNQDSGFVEGTASYPQLHFYFSSSDCNWCFNVS